jgi:septum formation protein
LLRLIGLRPFVLPADVDERLQPGEPPREAVLRLARSKADAVRSRLRAPGILLAADTAVVVDGRCLGKPADHAEAGEMLRRLRGRDHQVLTGTVLQRTDTERATGGVDATLVRFRNFDDRTLEAYLACGEWADKAGAYGIQGRGGLLVERIEGSWTNVVGLPLERLPGWLSELGVDLWELLGDERGAD